jgi:predicted permease
VSLALMIAAALFIRTLRNLEQQDIGVSRDNVWMFWMAPMEAGRSGDALAPLLDAAQERLATIPGVVSVSSSTDGVLSGFVGLRAVGVQGRVTPPGEDGNAQWNLVGPKFFETIGMRLVAGRDFGPQDTASAPAVAVINETMARQFFDDSRPLGRRFGFGRELSRLIEVVGVVKDAKYFSARDANVPMAFLPYRQDVAHVFRMCVVVRTASNDPGLISRIRSELQNIDPGVPLRMVSTTTGQLDETLSEERLTAWLAAAFGGLALLLACIGLYGLLSYIVTRRTREIGIRMAIGATRSEIIKHVVWDSALLVLLGIALGAPAAALAMHSVRAMLFNVSSTDPWTMGASAIVLIAVAAAATLLPARRASTVNPLVALRTE